MRLFLTLLIGSFLLALVLLFLGALARVTPGAPVVAVALGVVIMLSGLWVLRAAARTRTREGPEEPEDVGELDVYFVCGECGTEFRVEKIGELQVPRHCGEAMRVERRPRAVADGAG